MTFIEDEWNAWALNWRAPGLPLLLLFRIGIIFFWKDLIMVSMHNAMNCNMYSMYNVHVGYVKGIMCVTCENIKERAVSRHTIRYISFYWFTGNLDDSFSFLFFSAVRLITLESKSSLFSNLVSWSKRLKAGFGLGLGLFGMMCGDGKLLYFPYTVYPHNTSSALDDLAH